MEITKNDKVVFIMGAGASADKADDIPVQDKFLEQIINHQFKGCRWDFKEYSKNAKEIADKLFQTSAHSNLPSMETIFNILETAIKKESGLGDISLEQVTKYHKYLLAAVAVITRATNHSNVYDIMTKNPSSPYTLLGKKIYNYYSEIENQNPPSFITFNYDVCLDRVIISMIPDEGEPIYMDLGIHLGSYDVDVNSKFYFDKPDFNKKKIFLLRPHGSLNWLFCRSCGKIFTKKKSQIGKNEIEGKTKCELCEKGILVPYIIHPSYEHNYERAYIDQIWVNVEDVLQKSNKWCFIGYSLPEADRYFQYVLMRSYMVRKAKNQITDISVVGLDDDRYAQLIKRYGCFFKISNGNYYKDGFKHFAEKNLHFN